MWILKGEEGHFHGEPGQKGNVYGSREGEFCFPWSDVFLETEPVADLGKSCLTLLIPNFPTGKAHPLVLSAWTLTPTQNSVVTLLGEEGCELTLSSILALTTGVGRC